MGTAGACEYTAAEAPVRYLTTLQMAQFVLVFFHALLPLYFTCDYPVIVAKVEEFLFVLKEKVLREKSKQFTK